MGAIAADLPGEERVHYEKIGGQEWELREAVLDVHSDVVLWPDNPRLLSRLPVAGVKSEADLEAALQQTGGYEALRKSIDDLGQMEAVYVQKMNEGRKFLVLEGATRVCILRQLDRRYTGGLKEGTFRQVKAKVLPPNFSEKDRAVLLARIHVRGPGVRSWGRYIEAKFVFETVVGSGVRGPLMNQAQMAQHMEKSESWVNRLKNAYEFAQKFVEHVDGDGAEQLAVTNFSTLEEISKAKLIGSQVRDYGNPAYDSLRDDVFQMVRNEAFSEYRDARFLHEFHADPDKWEQLKSGEKHVASRLALEVRSNENSPKTKIAAIPQMVRRSIDRGEAEFDDEDIEQLQNAIGQISNELHQGVRPFRVALRKMTQTLSEASLADVRMLDAGELKEFDTAHGYFTDLVRRHGPDVPS